MDLQSIKMCFCRSSQLSAAEPPPQRPDRITKNGPLGTTHGILTELMATSLEDFQRRERSQDFKRRKLDLAPTHACMHADIHTYLHAYANPHYITCTDGIDIYRGSGPKPMASKQGPEAPGTPELHLPERYAGPEGGLGLKGLGFRV